MGGYPAAIDRRGRAGLTRDGPRLGSMIPFVDRSTPSSPPSADDSGSLASARCQLAVSCFIATCPRSGSWFLAEALANTGLVGIPNEYFRPDFTALWAAEWGLTSDIPYRAYVEAAKNRTATANGVFSAKLHWYQFAWLCGHLSAQRETPDGGSVHEKLGRWFPNLKYVFLWRRDTARQAVSYYRASMTQVWFLTDTTSRNMLAGDLDLQQIKWFEDTLIEHRANWKSYFSANGITPLEVVYEDLASDYQAAVHEILSYLGVAKSAGISLLPPTLRRQSDDQTEAILESYLTARNLLAPRPEGLSWSATERRFRSQSPRARGSGRADCPGDP